MNIFLAALGSLWGAFAGSGGDSSRAQGEQMARAAPRGCERAVGRPKAEGNAE